jgi:hypothetical protein
MPVQAKPEKKRMPVRKKQEEETYEPSAAIPISCILIISAAVDTTAG